MVGNKLTCPRSLVAREDVTFQLHTLSTTAESSDTTDEKY